MPVKDIIKVNLFNQYFDGLGLFAGSTSVVMIHDLTEFRMETYVYSDIVEIVFKIEILNHREEGLIRHILNLGIDEFQMLDKSLSRPRSPIFTPVTFRSVMGIETN